MTLSRPQPRRVDLGPCPVACAVGVVDFFFFFFLEFFPFFLLFLKKKNQLNNTSKKNVPNTEPIKDATKKRSP